MINITVEKILSWKVGLSGAYLDQLFNGSHFVTPLQIIEKWPISKARKLEIILRTLNSSKLKLLVHDFSDHALSLFDDPVSGSADIDNWIQVSRDFAEGNATQEELDQAKSDHRTCH